jgi:hypothetical protein
MKYSSNLSAATSPGRNFAGVYIYPEHGVEVHPSNFSCNEDGIVEFKGDERGLRRKRVEKLNGNETFGKRKFVLYSRVFYFSQNRRENTAMFLKKIREQYTIAPWSGCGLQPVNHCVTIRIII